MKEPCLTDAKSLREKRQGRFSYGKIEIYGNPKGQDLSISRSDRMKPEDRGEEKEAGGRKEKTAPWSRG